MKTLPKTLPQRKKTGPFQGPFSLYLSQSARRESNPRPSPWQGVNGCCHRYSLIVNFGLFTRKTAFRGFRKKHCQKHCHEKNRRRSPTNLRRRPPKGGTLNGTGERKKARPDLVIYKCGRCNPGRGSGRGCGRGRRLGRSRTPECRQLRQRTHYSRNWPRRCGRTRL